MAGTSSAYPEGTDVILRGDDNGIPWIGRLRRNIAAKADGAAAKVLIHWFYRAHDIAPERLRLLERMHGVKVQPNELFLTSHADENPLASIKQRANVTNVPSSDKVRHPPAQQDQLLCRFAYNHNSTSNNPKMFFSLKTGSPKLRPAPKKSPPQLHDLLQAAAKRRKTESNEPPPSPKRTRLPEGRQFNVKRGERTVHPQTGLCGEVAAVSGEWVTVTWEDGDSEDLSRAEVMRMLCQAQLIGSGAKQPVRPSVAPVPADGAGAKMAQQIQQARQGQQAQQAAAHAALAAQAAQAAQVLGFGHAEQAVSRGALFHAQITDHFTQQLMAAEIQNWRWGGGATAPQLMQLQLQQHLQQVQQAIVDVQSQVQQEQALLATRAAIGGAAAPQQVPVQ